MNSTVVFDLETDAKFSDVMYKHYNTLESGATEEQEREVADQILTELKREYSYFVKIVEGERVEVSENDNVLFDIILENIQQREETKALWSGKPRANQKTKPARQLSPSNEHATTSPIFPRKKQTASDPPQYNEQLAREPSAQRDDQSENKLSPKSEQPKLSILEDRLPSKKQLEVNSRTPIETVSQLVQILQLASHKLNDLHGSTRRHCKVIRLNQMPELGGEGAGVPMPTLSELAQCMRVPKRNILKWFEMLQYAENKGYDLSLYGKYRLDRHRGMFEEGEFDDDIYVLDESGESAIETHFDRVAQTVLKEIKDCLANKSVRSSLDDVKDSDEEIDEGMKAAETIQLEQHDKMNEKLGHGMNAVHDDVTLVQGDDAANGSVPKQLAESDVLKAKAEPQVESMEVNEPAKPAAEVLAISEQLHPDNPKRHEKLLEPEVDHASEKETEDSLEPPLVDYDLSNDVAMLPQDSLLLNEAGEISVEQIEEEANDSYNQMKSSIAKISDAIGSRSEKNATKQPHTAGKLDLPTNCDGAMNTSPAADSYAEPATEPSKAESNFAADVSHGSDIAPYGMTNDPDLGQTDALLEESSSLLNKIRKGSRIFVKWGKDGTLYKATVKKVLKDRVEPSIKVHYDGKKSHIVDSVSLDMIDRLISEDETESKHENDTCDSEPVNISIKELLRGRYQASLPVGKLEHREQCPELGAGWTVYITARRNQEEQNRTRADRYFISPSGKSCRSITALEQYFLEHPEEFDLYYSEDDFDDAIADEMTALPGSTNSEEDEGVHSTIEPSNESQAAEELKGSLPQCQGTDQSLPTVPLNPESEIHHYSHHFGADSFSPLMIGQSHHAIEDSHSDHEFLSSLMDEKGLLFGDEELEADATSNPAKDQPGTSHATASEEGCTLKPISCMKSSSLKVEEGDDNVKKNVHFAEQNNTVDSVQDGDLSHYQERKRGLSPRMKHNKKSLIGGIVPVFAMDTPAGAEFAG